MSVKVVWKYPIPAADEFTVEMPEGTEVVTVQTQRDEPMFWALLDPDVPKYLRTFRVLPTGRELPDAEQWTYRGTFQVHDGSLVFHLMERRSHAI